MWEGMHGIYALSLEVSVNVPMAPNLTGVS